MLLPTAWEAVTSSPMDHPLRSLFSFVAAAVLTYGSLRILGSTKSGVTFKMEKAKPQTLQIIKGKVKTSKTHLTSYNNPIATALLGLFFYISANIMLVIAFKSVEYFFG